MLSYAKASERCCGNLRQGFEGTILFFVKAWRRVTVEVSAEARVASAKRAILFFAEASKEQSSSSLKLRRAKVEPEGIEPSS